MAGGLDGVIISKWAAGSSIHYKAAGIAESGYQPKQMDWTITSLRSGTETQYRYGDMVNLNKIDPGGIVKRRFRNS